MRSKPLTRPTSSEMNHDITKVENMRTSVKQRKVGLLYVFSAGMKD